MSARTIGYRTAWIVSLALLLVTGVLGVYNAVSERGEAETALQWSVTIGVFLYGVLGLITAYGLIRRARWTLGTAVAWAIAVTYVPGVAVMAFEGEDAMLGSAIAASVGSALVALGVLWTTSVMNRPSRATPPAF